MAFARPRPDRGTRAVILTLRSGENEAIALAQERNCWLLIDDGAPRDVGRGPLGLRVVDSPAFAVFLYDQRRITYEQSMAALRLSQADHRVTREALILLVATARRRGGAP